MHRIRGKKKSHLLTMAGLYKVGGEGKASTSRITSRILLLVAEEQHVLISWYHYHRSSRSSPG